MIAPDSMLVCEKLAAPCAPLKRASARPIPSTADVMLTAEVSIPSSVMSATPAMATPWGGSRGCLRRVGEARRAAEPPTDGQRLRAAPRLESAPRVGAMLHVTMTLQRVEQREEAALPVEAGGHHEHLGAARRRWRSARGSAGPPGGQGSAGLQARAWYLSTVQAMSAQTRQAKPPLMSVSVGTLWLPNWSWNSDE